MEERRFTVAEDDPAMTIEALLSEGSTKAFVAVVQRVKGRSPDPGDVEAWDRVREEPARGEQLFRLLVASGALELEGYTLEGPPPADFRSRLAVQDLLKSLGRLRHEPAWSTLCEVWRGHPVRELRIYAAHGLLEWGTAAALEAVAQRVDDATAVELTLAVRAVFRLDPGRACERLEASWVRDPERREPVLTAAFGHLLRSPEDAADPRWRELAEGLVKRGSGASSSLRRLARDWLATAPEPTVRTETAAPPSVDQAAREESLNRARERVARLRDRLVEATDMALEPASAAALEDLEQHVGLLPATVRAWYELVGGLDLRNDATRPEDALVVMSLDVLLADVEDEPRVSSLPADEVIPCVLRVFPEPLAKAGYSAGPGLGVAVAAPGELPPDDPPLVDDPDGRTFLEHIAAHVDRLCHT